MLLTHDEIYIRSSLHPAEAVNYITFTYGFSALDKLLGQLGIYATWLSSIAYLQKQLCIFIIFFTPHIFSVITRFLTFFREAIGNVLAYLSTPIVCLSKVSK